MHAAHAAPVAPVPGSALHSEHVSHARDAGAKLPWCDECGGTSGEVRRLEPDISDAPEEGGSPAEGGDGDAGAGAGAGTEGEYIQRQASRHQARWRNEPRAAPFRPSQVRGMDPPGRQRVLLTMLLPSAREATDWARALQRLGRGLPVVRHSGGGEGGEGGDALEGAVLPAPRRRLLVIASDASGMGTAKDLLGDHWRPLLEQDGGCEVEEMWTSAPGDAQSMMQRLDVSRVDAAVACGGDGILHEMVQGMLGRDDWARARLLPLGHLPAGSGNGMSRSAASAAREPWDRVSPAFLLCKGGVSPLDVAATDVWPEGEKAPRRVYSIHQIEWAVAADIDRESEAYRCLGPDRFTVAGVVRAFCVRWYGGRLFLLRAGHKGVGPVGAGGASYEPGHGLEHPSEHKEEERPAAAPSDSGGITVSVGAGDPQEALLGRGGDGNGRGASSASAAGNKQAAVSSSNSGGLVNPSVFRKASSPAFDWRDDSTRSHEEASSAAHTVVLASPDLPADAIHGEGGPAPAAATSGAAAPRGEEAQPQDGKQEQATRHTLRNVHLPPLTSTIGGVGGPGAPLTQATGSTPDAPRGAGPGAPSEDLGGRRRTGGLGAGGRWEVVEGTFSYFWACSSTHQSYDVSAAPHSRFDDGAAWVTHAGPARCCGMVQLLLGLDEDGGLTRLPWVDEDPVVAWRLEPGPKAVEGTQVMVDGEAVGHGPVQSEIHRGLLRLITGVPMGDALPTEDRAGLV